MQNYRQMCFGFLLSALVMASAHSFAFGPNNQGISSFTVKNETEYPIRAQLKKGLKVLAVEIIEPGQGESYAEVKQRYSVNEYLGKAPGETELINETQELSLKRGESLSDTFTLELFFIKDRKIKEVSIAKLTTKHIYERVADQIAPRTCSYNDIHTFVKNYSFKTFSSSGNPQFSFKHLVGPEADYCYSVGYHHILVKPAN